MNKCCSRVLVAMLLLGGLGIARAQDEPATTPPPKVMQIIREFVKLEAGAAHEKAEGGFVQAFARAKWPTHYFAASALTGKPRVLFFVAYDSFEAWEKRQPCATEECDLIRGTGSRLGDRWRVTERFG